MLSDIRVLEISAPETMMAGRILCDLGADVVTVEPPGGAAGRRLEPFLGGVPGLERGLTWHALNRGKRGMTLDPGTVDGRALLARLAEAADVVVEGAGPSAEAPSVLPELPDRVIRCRVTPFLSTGAKRDYLATDLVIAAATGAPGATGLPDRPPLFHAVPQTIVEGGAEAAIACLAALVARDGDGLGQAVEAPRRLAGMLSALSVPVTAAAGGPIPKRGPSRAKLAGVDLPAILPCADGWVILTLAFGPAFGPLTARLVAWAVETAALAPRFAEIDWPAAPKLAADGALGAADVEDLVAGLSRHCAGLSKEAFGEAARRLGLLAAPLFDMHDILRSAQHRERGLWSAPFALHPGGLEVEDPARFVQASGHRIEVARPAPALSEHTGEILGGELGLAPSELQALFVHGVI